MKWYEMNYVSRRDWILDRLPMLQLTPAEFEIVMLIDFMNEHHMTITNEDLVQRTQMSAQMCDHTISSLCSRNYLTIVPVGANISFQLNGLFETENGSSRNPMDSSLFDLFETEFGRPLSQNEMQKLSEWNSTTDKQLIVMALREASIRQKMSMSYIDKILVTWKKKGITADTAGKI